MQKNAIYKKDLRAKGIWISISHTLYNLQNKKSAKKTLNCKILIFRIFCHKLTLLISCLAKATELSKQKIEKPSEKEPESNLDNEEIKVDKNDLQEKNRTTKSTTRK